MTAKRQDLYPLTPMQQGMLFHSLYAPDSGVYIEQFSCTLQGPRGSEGLNVAAFERAWRHLLERHTILRTGFVGQSLKEPVQVVYQQAPLVIHQEDWRALDFSQRQANLQAFMAEDRRQGFDLARPPLMRLALLRVTDHAFEFVWTYHHILLDGWSMPLLLGEFLACYEAYCGDRPVGLPPSRPYRDYIVWLRKQDTAKAESFWRRSLQGIRAPTPLVIDGAPTAPGPSTSDVPEVDESADASRQVRLSPEVTSSLQALARRNGLTLNTVVQAAWGLLLSRYSGEPDVLFGATVSGRPVDLSGAETMIGLFINTVPVRVRVDEELPLVSWLQSLQGQQAEVQQFSFSPLVQIQGWSEVSRGQPLFETLMVFENYPVSSASLGTGQVSASAAARDRSELEFRNIRSIEQTNYPITFVVGVDREMMLRIIYDPHRLSDASIVRMLGHLRTLLEGMAAPWTAAPSIRVKDLALLTAAEQRYLLVELNYTRRESPPYQSAHEWFEAQAARTPDALALSFTEGSAEGEPERRRMTYHELNERANLLAHYMRARGVGPDVLVGLCLERSLELVVGILAVLKAGGAYVPLDPAYPPERLLFMVEDYSRFGAEQRPGEAKAIVVTQDEFAPLWRSPGREVVCVDTDWEAIAREGRAENPASGVAPDHLAYVIYTSGSTGKPKGALLHHRGLVNVVRAFMDKWRCGPGTRMLQFFSPSFDGSVCEILGALLSGSTLCLADRDTISSPPALWRLLRDERIDTAFLAPAMWAALPADPLPDLRVLSAGGEALLPEVVRRWLTPDRRFINFYGPTEATIASTCYEMDEPPAVAASIPIGRPLDNNSIYLLDARQRLVPMGAPGELCIGGVQLARGYLNRPELTENKFVRDPFAGSVPAHDPPTAEKTPPRLYRTGDLARYLPDGNIEFLGRIDDQVKIRGFRIELGEIEAVLGQYPGVQHVAVAAREERDAGTGKRLVAYLEKAALHGGAEPDYTTGALRAFLQNKLPAYMIPANYVFVHSWPLTPSGKIDRRALPAPEEARSDDDQGSGPAYVAPRDALEVQLARIWEQVLDVERVGVLDDFFELGGHSLLAVRVIGQVEQALGVKVPVMALFQQPTIEGLAGALRAKGSPAALPPAEEGERQDPDPSILIKIQPHGDRRPLFFVHPSGGSVHWFTDLARRLGREQPFYGLQARGLEADAPIDDQIETMAGRYVREMRLAQPQGPYQLGSWSMGVIVAYEMACQLAEAGQEVALLALLDQGPLLPLPKAEDQAAYLVDTFGQHLPLSAEALRKLPEEEQVPFVYQVARKRHFIYPDVKLEQFRHFIHILRTHTEAWRQFTPRPYPGRLTLFRAEKQPKREGSGPMDGPDMGWGALARGGVAVRDVPGDHLSMVHEPDVRGLARALAACLDEAGAAKEAPLERAAPRASR